MCKKTLLMGALLALGPSPAWAEPPSVKISFQPADVPTWPGDLPDSGEPFADRGNGQAYGWNVSHVSRAKYFPPPFPGMNLRYWTAIQMSLDSSTSWEIAVPNGSYQVMIAAGGPVRTHERQLIRAEDVTVVDDRPGDYEAWVSGSATVTVSDGRLTVTNGPAATNNWIVLIEIEPR